MSTNAQAYKAYKRLGLLRIRQIAWVTTIVLTVSACASISEDQCAAGNWAERGYKDGLKGKSSASISKYSASIEHL